ncbi:dihydrofolate reductase isoform X2 [Periplaneta americana]|uniref:dihydrofolate reductase isoform X2 n=1 Tax=Periplaneta americana TaxID=6978 RepID=UPI0037E92F26
MNLKLNIIVAVSENMGIGLNGDLPWRLRKEMAHFAKLTKHTQDPQKKNAVIMGRKTWESIPAKNRPLAGRLNIVLSRHIQELGDDVLVRRSLEDALSCLQEESLGNLTENVWVIGGSSVYKEALTSPFCHRVYLTRVLKTFECDAFFPEIPEDSFKIVRDSAVSEDIQEEDGITYKYQVYQRVIDK